VPKKAKRLERSNHDIMPLACRQIAVATLRKSALMTANRSSHEGLPRSHPRNEPNREIRETGLTQHREQERNSTSNGTDKQLFAKRPSPKGMQFSHQLTSHTYCILESSVATFDNIKPQEYYVAVKEVKIIICLVASQLLLLRYLVNICLGNRSHWTHQVLVRLFERADLDHVTDDPSKRRCRKSKSHVLI
jgi:hypothetical protein